MIFKRPFTTEGEVQFRLADGERTRMPAERWMQMETTSRHIFELQWHSQQLRLVIDNTHIIGLFARRVTVAGSMVSDRRHVRH